MNPVLSIVIVSYNARADLARCLASLAQAPPSIAHEVIVVDNRSSDGSADQARAAGATTIEMAENAGFSAANNAGIRASRGQLLLLLNSDTIVPAGAIDGLAAILRARPEVGVVGPRLVDGEGRAELSFGPMLSPLVEWRRRRLMQRLAQRDKAAVTYVEGMTRQEQFPDWVTGACLLVRRTDAVAAGLLDARFFMYTEVVVFCAAIRALGRRVMFTPAVQVTHIRGRSAASAPDATRHAYSRSHIAFYQKHHPRLVPLVRLYHWVIG
jgi:GT2 family glycosyltransferase